MKQTLTPPQLFVLAAVMIMPKDARLTLHGSYPLTLDELVSKKLITIGEPSSGITRTDTPFITDRGRALIGFMCNLPLPVANTTWVLPDDIDPIIR
jgi:hypothetical protein